MDTECKTDRDRLEKMSDAACARFLRQILKLGSSETDISKGVVLDLHKSVILCPKNGDHKAFKKFSTFTKDDLPQELQDERIFNVIKAQGNLCVRVSVCQVSDRRLGTENPADDVNRLLKAKGFKLHGSGFLKDVKRHKNRACPCKDCKVSDQPFPEWGEVYIMTAAHVVFDDTEASHTKCEFFYDDPVAESDKIVTLEGFVVVESDSVSDRCLLKYVTHDMKLLQMFNELLEDYWKAHHRTFELQNPVTQMALDLWRLVAPKDRWMVMISHPHACVKQVTIGKCRPKKWSRLFFQKTQYIYTTPTCIGCSGSAVNVFMPRWNITTWCDHGHCGADNNLSPSKFDEEDGIGDEVMVEFTLFWREQYNKGRGSCDCTDDKSGDLASGGGKEKDKSENNDEEERRGRNVNVIYNLSGVGNDDRLFQRMFMCGLVLNLISSSLNTAYVLQHQITNASMMVFLMLSFNLFMAGLSLLQIFGVLIVYFSTMVGAIWMCEETSSLVLSLSPLVVLVIYWMYTSPIRRKIQEVHWISSMTVYLQLVCLVMLCDFTVMTAAKWLRLILCLVLVLFVSKKVHRSSYEAGSRCLRLYLVAVVYVLSSMFLLAILDETNPNDQEDRWFPNFAWEWDCLWRNSDSNMSQAMADVKSNTEITCPSELRKALDGGNTTLGMPDKEGSFSSMNALMISVGLRLMLLVYEFLPT